jgi:endogenous inhibitor of DNA gyrase (YacG/DUF329 family)
MGERVGPTGNMCYMCKKPLDQPKRGRLRLTCSDKCRQARHRRKIGQRSWLSKRIQRLNAKHRALPFMERRLNRQSFKPVLELGYRRKLYECMTCGKQYVEDRISVGGRTRHYCSDRCAEFTANQLRRYSKALRKANERGKRIDPRVLARFDEGKLSPLCLTCGIPFAPNTTMDGEMKRGRPRIYCSDTCAKMAYEQRWKDEHDGRARRHRFRDCAECGTRFDRTDTIGRRRMRFCSTACNGTFQDRVRAVRDAAKENGQTEFKWGATGHGTAAKAAKKNRKQRGLS